MRLFIFLLFCILLGIWGVHGTIVSRQWWMLSRTDRMVVTVVQGGLTIAVAAVLWYFFHLNGLL